MSIIILWTHPRSISTAFERMVMQHPEVHVEHEPFSHWYYLEHSEQAAHYDAPQEQPKTYDQIKQCLLSYDAAKVVFVKDMAYHVWKNIQEDIAFLKQVKHVFLIRNPEQAIPSLYAKNTNVSSEEVGYDTLWKLYQKVYMLLETKPLILESELLRSNPEEVLHLFCHYVGLSFSKEMLQWDAELPEAWSSWKHWHYEVSRSTAIHQKEREYPHTTHNHPMLASYAEHHIPFYLKLKSEAAVI